MNYSILSNKNKSYGSKDVDNNISLDIHRTSRQFTHNDIVGTLDVNEQFLNERNACKDFRLTLTINPFCSNELFNSCTEVIWREGSDKCKGITNLSEEALEGIMIDEDNRSLTENFRNIIGKTMGVSRIDMIRNTEYSSEHVGFEYHPGYDMFNNHILRNKSYRIVNPIPKNSNSEVRNRFNTINDYMRLANGTPLEKCNRLSIEDTSFVEKHLYDREDILRFDNGESKEENLREENGWFGFYNTSVIPSKSLTGNALDINRAINNKGNCEFIDMYPDRTLFSFVPKYNKYKNRLEENWKILLTYPFEHTVKDDYDRDFYIVQSGNTNALAIASVEYVLNQTGTNVLLFRTYTKHNLKPNDSVYLYFSENEDTEDNVWNKSKKPYRVSSVGNLNGEYSDYYFTVYDSELLNDIFATTRDENYTDWDYVRDYFYKKVTNSSGIPQNSIIHYGIDGLTNIPSSDDVYIEAPDENNVMSLFELYSRDTGKTYRQMTEHDQEEISVEDFIRMCINNAFIINDPEVSQTSLDNRPFKQNDVYIQFRFTKVRGNVECKYYVRKFKNLPNIKNGHSGMEDMPYDNEKYRLGYAETIYGDPILQTVFTDSINTTGVENNLGAEPKEVFVTIIKNNTGHNEWYDDLDPHYTDYTDSNDVFHKIEFSHCFGRVTCGFDFFSLPDDNLMLRQNRKSLGDVKFIYNEDENVMTLGNKKDITIDNDWFYGDIVEFNPNRYTETILCNVAFRFNTAQRELVGNEHYRLIFDDIKTDDFDYGGFELEDDAFQSVVKKEGYYYNPHYKIKLRGYGPIIQDANFNVLIKSAEPYQNNGIYIKVTTGLRHNCAVNDRLVLKDNTGTDEWELKVVSVLSPFSFIMTKIERDDPNYRDWFLVCEFLNNGSYSLKRVNESIPKYALKTGGSTYIWREPKNAWDIDNEDTEIKEYLFANGNLYIDETINFYLKRQDPDNVNGLWPNNETYPYMTDAEGERNKIQSIYAYKEEYQAIC